VLWWCVHCAPPLGMFSLFYFYLFGKTWFY
jgi:hypothetical protein